MKRKKIVTIGGGTGSFTLLSGLREYTVGLSAIVSMADDGGSTGILRDELGVLPPGDIRQCLIALSHAPRSLRKLFTYRFDKGGLQGHNFGNIFISTLEKVTGNFELAIEKAAKILDVSGEVIPVTLQKANLRMVLQDGTNLNGENKIYLSKKILKKGIKSYQYIKSVQANKKALDRIRDADLITIGPGDHYSSILPNLLIPGITKALRKTKARIIYIPNLTNKKGQTDGYAIHDYIRDIEKYLGKNRIDTIIINTKRPSNTILNSYVKKEGTNVFVPYSKNELSRYKIKSGNFLSAKRISKNKADALSTNRSFIRHDSKSLSSAIMKLV